MPGLIPLMLNPVAAGNRSSVIFAPSTQTRRHSRGQSINHLPLPVLSPLSPSFSANTFPIASQRASLPVSPKSKPAKRLSLASPAALPVLPYTPEDWKRAIAEVKRQHANRRYRACFTRCDEILDNMKDVSNVEPAYLISLHFYAATSMEMCARPLSAPSTYRADLIQRARRHYDRAGQLVRDAEESAHFKFRASFSLLSLSSPHSPSGSISSRAWTSETGRSSPTPSVCSSEDLNARLHQSHFPSPPSLSSFSKPAPRKKVSFELPKDVPVIFEPFIRPDSPTLGVDDEYFATGLARQELPQIPSCTKMPPVSSPILHQVGDDDATPRASRDFCSLNHSSRGSLDVESEFDRRSFQLDRSTSRYCEHLSNLKSRLAQHRANLEDIIETPASSDNKNVITDRSSTPVDDDARSLDRKARIERLRKSGWQRKRFDPSRYEALRNAALSELD